MDDSAGLLTVLIIAFTLMNGYFSLMETALTQSKRGVLEKQAESGVDGASDALAVISEPEKYLSVTQIGITLMSILSGLTAGLLLFPLLNDVFSFLPRPSIAALAASVAASAFFLLLFGEFLPKKAALQYPERTLVKYYDSLAAATWLLTPAVKVLGNIADTVLLVFGQNPQVEDAVTEDEVKDLIEQGTSEGTFEKTEQDMVDRIFRLGDQTAYSLMTPRTQMLWLDLADSNRHNLRLIRENDRSVFPVGRESLDKFCGVIYTKEILNASLRHENLDLARFVHKPMNVPRSLDIFRLLQKFRGSGTNEAVVLDEYGGVIGFITLNDIMEEIIGETTDDIKTQVTLRDEKSWYIDGLMSIDDFKERFELLGEKLPDEERDHYQTVGGFVTSLFGYIPKIGESIVFSPKVADANMRFEIVAMDRARIDKVLVRKEPLKRVEPKPGQ